MSRPTMRDIANDSKASFWLGNNAASHAKDMRLAAGRIARLQYKEPELSEATAVMIDAFIEAAEAFERVVAKLEQERANAATERHPV